MPKAGATPEAVLPKDAPLFPKILVVCCCGVPKEVVVVVVDFVELAPNTNDAPVDAEVAAAAFPKTAPVDMVGPAALNNELDVFVG